jgi:hypothetical protein
MAGQSSKRESGPRRAPILRTLEQVGAAHCPWEKQKCGAHIIEAHPSQNQTAKGGPPSILVRLTKGRPPARRAYTDEVLKALSVEMIRSTNSAARAVAGSTSEELLDIANNSAISRESESKIP